MEKNSTDLKQLRVGVWLHGLSRSCSTSMKQIYGTYFIQKMTNFTIHFYKSKLAGMSWINQIYFVWLKIHSSHLPLVLPVVHRSCNRVLSPSPPVLSRNLWKYWYLFIQLSSILMLFGLFSVVLGPRSAFLGSFWRSLRLLVLFLLFRNTKGVVSKFLETDVNLSCYFFFL